MQRREFLKAAALAGLAPSPAFGGCRSRAQAVIFINLVGGPSQLDTWDPKPDAPSDVRSPFGSIATRTPGVYFSELFPQMAAMSDRFAVVRTMHHDAAPIHENGLQLLNTGHRFGHGPEVPHFGARIAAELGARNGPAWWVFPHTEIDAGLGVPLGFTANLGRSVALGGGPHGLGELLDAAATAIEAGARCAVVNQFATVFDRITWDCHAAGGSLASDLGDYRDTLAPEFDAAFPQLLERLQQNGLLERTLVVAAGEFGRTPKRNANGGRDHWPACWSALLAGGGIRGGQVLGTSDACAAAPKDRPVTCPELVATIFHALGLPADVPAVRELF